MGIMKSEQFINFIFLQELNYPVSVAWRSGEPPCVHEILSTNIAAVGLQNFKGLASFSRLYCALKTAVYF